MFENCDSCIAAEQFVDIRSGAKYLLTLTSNTYDKVKKQIFQDDRSGITRAFVI